MVVAGDDVGAEIPDPGMNHDKALMALVATTLVVLVGGVRFLMHASVSPVDARPDTASGAIASGPAPTPETRVSLIAVGDIMLSRTVEQRMKRHGMDYPLRETAGFLRGADITFGNLECPITPGRAVAPFTMSFRAPVESAVVLRDAGFDMLSLANNHSMNFGAKGITDTFRYLAEKEVAFVGAGKDAEEANAPRFIGVQGLRFAFLAYNDDDVVPDGYEAADKRPGTAFMRILRMQEAVKAAKAQADFVLVSMHSGVEYVNKPNGRQTDFAHAAIDAGAEMVIGHHPHVVQTLEKYKGKYIFYSLGNFVFDQMDTRDTREGLAMKVTFGQGGVMNITLHPVLIHDYAQPRLLSGVDAEEVVKKLNYSVAEDSVFGS